MSNDMEQSLSLLPPNGGSRFEEKSSPRDFISREWPSIATITVLSRRASKLLRAGCYVFAPTIIRSHCFGERSPPPKLHATSWVDGIRGVGSLIVFNTHYLHPFNTLAREGYRDAEHSLFGHLPFIRWMYSGGLGVKTFFLVAGYVLSMKAFRLMRDNDANSRDKLLQSLASSAFRRFFRLYIPPIISMLLIAIFAYLGCFTWMAPYWKKTQYFSGYCEPQMQQFPTLGQHLQFWLHEVGEILNLTTPSKHFFPLSDNHLWSIRDQYLTSMCLFTALLTLSGTTEFTRLAILIIIDIYLVRQGMAEFAICFLGATVCQIDTIRNASSPSPAATLGHSNELRWRLARKYIPGRRHIRSWGNIVWFASVLLAFFLMSAPTNEVHLSIHYQYLYSWVSSMKRPQTILPTSGLVLLLFCLTFCTPTSISYRILTTNTVLYLTQIGFAFYLVHGSMLHSFGYRVPLLVWDLVGRDTGPRYWFGVFVGWAVNLGLVLWVADVYNREVDGRTALFVRWLEKRCLKS